MTSSTLGSAFLSRRNFVSGLLYRPHPKPSSQLFLIQTVNSPALPHLPAHFVWNASKTYILYIENIRLYAVKYVTAGTSRFLAQMMTSLRILFYIHSNKQKIQRKEGTKKKGSSQRPTEERGRDERENSSWKTFKTMIATERADISLRMFTTFHVYNARCM